MINIYICDRGFVFVGREREPQVGEDPQITRLEKSACVRVWGTTKGLGQLAMEGKLSGTVLDMNPDNIEIHESFIKIRIPCDEKAWKEFQK